MKRFFELKILFGFILTNFDTPLEEFGKSSLALQ